MKIDDYSIISWLFNQHIRTETGEPIDLKDHLFLFDIYRDFSPKQVIYKGAQIGFSTLAILKTMWLAKNRGIDIIYTLPSANDVVDFAGGKVNRIIANNLVMQSWVKEKDSVEQKKVGENVIYFRGCFDDKTQVLTPSGWKKREEITSGDKILSINPETKCVEIEKVKGVSRFKVKEEMLRVQSIKLDQLITFDHRVLTSTREGKWKIKRGYEIEKVKTLRIPKGWRPNKKGKSKYSAIEAELFGWIISEGSYWTKRDKSNFVRKDGTMNPKIYEAPRVCIIQKNHGGVERIRELLRKSNWGFYEKNHNKDSLRFELHSKISRKIKRLLPVKELTYELILSLGTNERRALLEGLIKGDGWNSKNNLFFTQKSKKTTEAFEFLCAILGISTNTSYRDGKHHWGKGIYVVTLKNDGFCTNPLRKREYYNGIAWCPETKNGIIIIKRNGKVSITGQTWTERQAIMISADLVVADEVDRSKQAIIDQYESRLQHSKYGWRWYFSNPSVEGNGVSKYWPLSDQKHWFIKCSNGHEWYMEWPDCIDFDRKVFVCSKCKVELTREERRKGRWVKRFQNKNWSGYWIPLLIAPWVTAEKIIEYYETKSPEYFYNFVLGLPYVGEGNKINPEDILQNCTREPNTQENVVIGVDVGLTKHFVVGNREGLFLYGKTKEWDDIERLLDKFKRSVAVIDALPDLTKPRELKEKYPGRVWLCTFGRDRKTMQFVRWGEKKEFGNVVADRNRMIQLTADEFIKKRISLEGNREEWQGYYSHWATMYRVNEWEEAKLQGKKNYVYTAPYRWESSTGNDHYVMACLAGNTLIETDKGNIKIEDVKEGDFVLTRGGYKKVSYSGLIKKNAEVMEAVFDSGSRIISTPEHKFWTQEGWKCLQSLQLNDILVGIWQKALFTKEKNTQSNKDITLRAERNFIEKYGNLFMEKLLKVFTSIIKTTTLLTTKLKIYNLFQEVLTLTLQRNIVSLKNLFVEFVKENIKQSSLATINTVLLSVGQEYMESNIIKLKGNVLSVQKGLQQTVIGEGLLAQKNVKIKELAKQKKQIRCQEINTEGSPVKLKSLKYLQNREDVYGITVEDLHEYYANGVLVANSTYWRVGMDRFGGGQARIFTENVLDRISDTSSTMAGRTIVDIKKIFNFNESKEDDWRI